MLVSPDGEVTITNDGATILQQMVRSLNLHPSEQSNLDIIILPSHRLHFKCLLFSNRIVVY